MRDRFMLITMSDIISVRRACFKPALTRVTALRSFAPPAPPSLVLTRRCGRLEDDVALVSDTGNQCRLLVFRAHSVGLLLRPLLPLLPPAVAFRVMLRMLLLKASENLNTGCGRYCIFGGIDFGVIIITSPP
jgi:hypothetical protein